MSGTGGRFDWEAVPFGSGVQILATHPCGLAAVNKPTGLLSHPNRKGDEARSVVTSAYQTEKQFFSIKRDGGDVTGRIWLLHRLDSATSGVLLLAADAAVAKAVRRAFEIREVTKKYIAVVLGHPREKRALWRDNMAVQRGRAHARVKAGGGVTAESAMRIIRQIPGPPALSLLGLEPHTGRTHQLRFQCAQRKTPILGDQIYGLFRTNRELARRFGTERLFLHAASIAVEFSVEGRRVKFAASAPDPEEFVAVVQRR